MPASGEALCYFGLIRGRDVLPRVLAMLPPERRKQAQTIIQDSAELSDLELRNKLAELRFFEAENLRRRLKVPPGVSIASVNPVLRRWLEWEVENGDGRQDHQSQSRR